MNFGADAAAWLAASDAAHGTEKIQCTCNQLPAGAETKFVLKASMCLCTSRVCKRPAIYCREPPALICKIINTVGRVPDRSFGKGVIDIEVSLRRSPAVSTVWEAAWLVEAAASGKLPPCCASWLAPSDALSPSVLAALSAVPAHPELACCCFAARLHAAQYDPSIACDLNNEVSLKFCN